MFFTPMKLSLPVFFIIYCWSVSPPGWNTSYVTFLIMQICWFWTFSLYMSEKKPFILPSFLKEIFAGYGTLGDKFLYFSTLICLSFNFWLLLRLSSVFFLFLGRGGEKFRYHVPWCNSLPHSLLPFLFFSSLSSSFLLPLPSYFLLLLPIFFFSFSVYAWDLLSFLDL